MEEKNLHKHDKSTQEKPEQMDQECQTEEETMP